MEAVIRQKPERTNYKGVLFPGLEMGKWTDIYFLPSDEDAQNKCHNLILLSRNQDLMVPGAGRCT